MVLNSIQSPCNNGIPQKCSTCNMQFMCSKSPHCSVAHINDNFDALSKYLSGFYNQYQNTLDTEKEIFVQMQQSTVAQNIKISELKEDYDNKYTELNSKIEKILTLMQEMKSESGVSTLMEQDTIEAPVVVQSGALELYDGDKKYVEKKNIFGKTKWVEDK